MNIFAKMLVRKKERGTPAARDKCGRRAGFVGIALNTLLAAGKIVFGTIAGALSVVADGLNNLTDCGSNVVSVIGFKMSGKPADKEHPFGHQRAESIAALVISVVILAVAVELIVQSVQKIFSPEASEFSLALAAVLGASVLVKLFMFVMNRALAKEFSSETLKATAVDSLSDAAATTAVLISLIISHYTGVELDGYMGIAVALFIGFSGVSILRETVSRLIGDAADAETVKKLKEQIFSFEAVHGIHDLTVHSYGRTARYATVHVEVDSHMPVMSAHDLADRIEKEVEKDTGILLTVHIDPLVLDDPKINLLREDVDKIVKNIDPAFRMHDFRVVGGTSHSNLIFDVAVPFDTKLGEQEIMGKLREGVSLLGENFDVVANIEKQNTDQS